MSKLTHGASYEQFLLAYARQRATDVKRDAGNLVNYTRQLQELPEWDTEAEQAVADAELALTEALLAVKLVANEFKRRRIEFFGIVAAE